MKTKICTTIEQSKKLLELGIDINTADMHYSTWTILNGEYILSPNQGETIEELQEDYGNQVIPAWSLAALLSIIPKHIGDSVFRMDMGETDIALWFDDLSSGTVDENLPDITEENFVDAAFEVILKLKEKGLL